MSRRLCFTLDLVKDAALIAAYEAHHAAGAVWPEVVADIRQSGIRDMEIWRVDERCFMICEVDADFPRPTDPVLAPVVARWEAAMDAFQVAPPNAEPGEKWRPMTRIFALAEQRE